MLLQVQGVSKSFASRQRGASQRVMVLAGITFSADLGEFLTVIGPSGCGKSTLLACIAGLIPYDSGTLLIGGRPVDGPLPECAVVFQQASLLPWRSVIRNVEYGLELDRVNASERRRIAQEALALVGLEHVGGHLPHELSGGMQQRVNLARALAMDPQLLLMDEPFGSLDALTKQRLQDELVGLTADNRRSTVFITHDVEEAVFLGDRILVMGSEPGRILEVVQVPLSRPRLRDGMGSADIQALIRHLRSMLMPQVEQTNPAKE